MLTEVQYLGIAAYISTLLVFIQIKRQRLPRECTWLIIEENFLEIMKMARWMRKFAFDANRCGREIAAFVH